MSAPIVFLDTETTGLSLTDDIWEFARRLTSELGERVTTHGDDDGD